MEEEFTIIKKPPKKEIKKMILEAGFTNTTETDILMFALYIVKANNSNSEGSMRLMPWLGNYTHEWTETEIAKKLKLTDEEVDYIHKEMKNFGWKVAPKKEKK